MLLYAYKFTIAKIEMIIHFNYHVTGAHIYKQRGGDSSAVIALDS